jgi:hypothetical protein
MVSLDHPTGSAWPAPAPLKRVFRKEMAFGEHELPPVAGEPLLDSDEPRQRRMNEHSPCVLSYNNH